MITRIEIENFKSLQKVDLALGNLNLFVGTNASGKSNFFDALRFLQGVGYGFTIDEILNGKPKSASSEVWEGVRGGGAMAAFVGKQRKQVQESAMLKFGVEFVHETHHYRYEIGIAPVPALVRREKLRVDGREVYRHAFDDIPEVPAMEVAFPITNGSVSYRSYSTSSPFLHQLLRHGSVADGEQKHIEACVTELRNMQRLDPSPGVLRDYSRAQSVKRMGERGENFAALVKTILSDPKDHEAYVSWLKQLTPVELDDVSVLAGALSEPLFAIREAGVDRPAPILSDGTLRFAAIAAAFFQKDMPDILTVEEIENGIHPSRLRLLVELLRSQSKAGDRQIMATTHSPIVLAWLKPEDYQHTFFCKRDEDTGASVIRALDQIPNFMDLVKKHPIGDLFAEGWLEGSL